MSESTTANVQMSYATVKPTARIDAFAVTALAQMVDAASAYKDVSDGDDLLSADTRRKIDRLVAAFCKQFPAPDDD